MNYPTKTWLLLGIAAAALGGGLIADQVFLTEARYKLCGAILLACGCLIVGAEIKMRQLGFKRL